MAQINTVMAAHSKHDCWSKLHPDLLLLIAKHVDSYVDYVRLRAVCKEWNLELPKSPEVMKNPWMVLPFGPKNIVAPFYNVGEKKIYPFKLSKTRNTVIVGSYYEWLIIIGLDGKIQMLNPFTKAQIQLPPISTIPDVIAYNPEKHKREYTIIKHQREEKRYHTKSQSFMQTTYIQKIIISPSHGDQGLIAVVIYGKSGKLAYCKLGDKKWTDIAVTEAMPLYRDALYHQGKIYSMNAYAELCEIDIEAGLINKLPPLVAILRDFDYYLHFIYLVGIPDGLIMVIRHEGFYQTQGFDIYKRLNDKEGEWSRVNDLGDHVLVLGCNFSVCMLAHTFPDRKGNRIYYADDWNDVGCFNLEDGTIHKLFPISFPVSINSSPISVAPVWLVYKS